MVSGVVAASVAGAEVRGTLDEVGGVGALGEAVLGGEACVGGQGWYDFAREARVYGSNRFSCLRAALSLEKEVHEASHD